ncbi:helix-turn-helix domain-containing protein [Sphingomonas sp. Xoc002]|uniref:helix-turn-helix domain-containing protein n=1 Tax=Sphingomonas sp. Xoc002 TaxID=2837624 RepID=UPI003D183F96
MNMVSDGRASLTHRMPRLPCLSTAILCIPAASSAATTSQPREVKVKGLRFETLEAICRHLDCQPGDLLEYDPDTPPDS